MKKVFSSIMVVLLLAGMLFCAVKVQPASADGWIFIRPDGTIDGTASIQTSDGVNYIFNASITCNSITVQRNNTIINGCGHTLEGTGVGSSGIDLSGTTMVTVKNIQIEYFNTGIALGGASDDSVTQNSINNCSSGIVLIQSSSNIISGNTINCSEYGIYLRFSPSNTISENTIQTTRTSGSGYGIYILESSSYNSIIRNNIRNNYFSILVDHPSSSSNSISGNTIEDNAWGVTLCSRYNSVTGNSIKANSFWGIELRSSSGNSIGNSISGNDIEYNAAGVDLDHSSSNSINGNNITNNVDGLALIFSTNNQIYNNTLVDNTQQVNNYESTNTWNNGYPSGGNYWSDYTGVDEKRGSNQDQLGSDGIGDTPYVIDSNNIDHYPLMNPWGSAPPIYDVTLKACCNTEGSDVSVAIAEDGSPTGFGTPHTFTGLAGSHTFTVAAFDANYHPFKQWDTSETTTTITVSSAGTRTAYYEAVPYPPINVVVTPLSNAINVSWVNPSIYYWMNQYCIYRSTSPDFVPWNIAPYATVDRYTYNYTDCVEDNAIYYYEVVANFTKGCSIPSTVVGGARLESLKGIESNITGVASLSTAPYVVGFTIQQNFYLNPVGVTGEFMYWCQNVVDFDAKNVYGDIIQYVGRMSMWVWIWVPGDAKWEPFEHSPIRTLFLNSITDPDDLYFRSEIKGGTLWMNNSVGSFPFTDLELTSDACISCEYYGFPGQNQQSYTYTISPNFVVAGFASGGTTDFTSGSGSVTCQTEIGTVWLPALKVKIIKKSEGLYGTTGETSKGLTWFNDTQGRPTGSFAYRPSAPDAIDQGIFFVPNFNDQGTVGILISNLGKMMKTLLLSSHCPVYLDLYDAQGNCIGYNQTSGQIDFHIDNAVYVSNQTLLVYDPSGTYNVKVTGTENGTYELETSWQDVAGISLAILDVNSTIVENETQNYAIGDSANVTLTSILPSKTVVFQGYDLQVNASVADLGGPDAVFNATLYANGTAVGKQNMLNVSGWNSANVCFTCNTTGLALGNYTLSANVQPTNSNFTGGNISVSMVGDLNGGGPTIWGFIPDGKCNILDVSAVANCFGSYPGCPQPLIWNVNCDVTGLTKGVPDDKVNILDVALVARHFGEHSP